MCLVWETNIICVCAILQYSGECCPKKYYFSLYNYLLGHDSWDIEEVDFEDDYLCCFH